MMQAVLHQLSQRRGGVGVPLPQPEDLRLYLPAIREQLEYLAGLAISDEQLAFLERIPFLASGLHPLPRVVPLQPALRADRHRERRIPFLRLKGPWLYVILFEVPLLAMISEVRNRARYPAAIVEQARERLQEKFDWCAGVAPRNWPASRWPTSVPAAASPIGSTRRW